MWKWLKARHDMEVPDWAGFFDGREYRDFVEAIAADLQRRSDVVEIEGGVARVEIEGGEEHRFGLQNLAQICNQSEPGEWPEIIRHHFDGVIRSTAGADLDGLSGDYARAKDLLKVRLYPREAVSDRLEELAYRDVAEGIVAVLTYDLPEAVATVPRDDVSRWPVSTDAAFERGMANVRRDDDAEHEEVTLSGGGTFVAAIGDSFFVTSMVMSLEEVLDPLPELGALVAVPNRHTMLFSPIVDLSVLDAINAMLVVARQRYAEGPGSLSPLVYWWRAGEFVVLPGKVEDGQVEVEPPEEFVEACLKNLPAPTSGYGPN